MNYKDYLRQSLKEDWWEGGNEPGDWQWGDPYDTSPIWIDDYTRSLTLHGKPGDWEGQGVDIFGNQRPDKFVFDVPDGPSTKVYWSMEDYYREVYGDEWYDKKFGEEEEEEEEEEDEEDETEVEPKEEPVLDTELSQEELDAILDAMKYYNVVQ
jgi:hypothetical protein